MSSGVDRLLTAFVHNHSSSPSWPALDQYSAGQKPLAVGPEETPDEAQSSRKVTVKKHDWPWHALARSHQWTVETQLLIYHLLPFTLSLSLLPCFNVT